MTSEQPQGESQGQAIEVVSTGAGQKKNAPRISRTPITWNSPPGSSSSLAPAAPQAAPAPTAVPRGVPRGRGTARRAVARRGAASRGSRGGAS